MLTVLWSGILVNRDFTSKETNLYPSLNRLGGILLIISCTASKLSRIVNSLIVKGFSNCVINLAVGW